MKQLIRAALRPVVRPLWQRVWWRIGARLQPVEARVEGLESRLQPVEARVEGLESRLQPVEARVEGLESRLQPIEARIEAVRAMALTQGQVGQLLLCLKYRELARQGIRCEILDTEFRYHSQNGEDGILLYLFSMLGTTNRKVVEICAGNGIECNAANLIVNHGWQALLFDGSESNVAAGRAFYASAPTTWCSPPTFVQAWITVDNVNQLVADNGLVGDIDLLSIDIDGNDYWILQALDVVRPRVVVLEFIGGMGPDVSVSMPYDPDFQLDYSVQPYRCGASLAAFTTLCIRKGYRLVGVQSRGFNAFFVREDLGTALIPTRSPRECYRETPRLQGWSPALTDLLLNGPMRFQEVR
jgi:hypothetical protein